MGKYTDIQAKAFTIIRAEKYKVDNVHLHYVFVVKGPQGQTIKFIDKDLSENADKATIKVAIIAHIRGEEKYVAEKAREVTSDDTVLNKKVDDIDKG